jgi:hypothetical protein
VRLSSHTSQWVLARVSIDGLNVAEGGLVLEGHETMYLERPVAE